MAQDLIKIEHISVCYSPIVRGGRKMAGLDKKRRKFWALQDVSFDIVPGEILGVIGKNGSGKSTMLRVLAGIIKPDSGELNMGGRATSLLALGSSLMTELSGRDNIYLIGLQLGFQREEIDAVCDDIVEFAELGDFIDQPVRTYSSGMRSKLSFSAAVHLPTEVLLIDELLSVGDMAFRQKSYARMKELINDKNHTVVIVSHDLGRLRTLCDRVLWLDSSSFRMIGDPAEVIRAYQEEYTQTEGKLLVSDVKVPDLLRVECTDDSITVFWGSVQDATGYIIYRKQENTGYKRITQVAGAMSDRYTDKTVETGQTYQYTVRAYRMLNGITDRSSVDVDGISGTAVTAKAPDTLPALQMPKLLGVYEADSVPTVIWECVPEATGYVVYWQKEDGSYEKIDVVLGAHSTCYEDRGSPDDYICRYTVGAYRITNGVTDRSQLDMAGISLNDRALDKPPVPETLPALEIPRLLEVQDTNPSLTVVWECVPDATGYVVYRASEGAGYKRIGVVVGNRSDRFEDKAPASGTTCRYTVGAYRICNGATDISSADPNGIAVTAG